MRKFLIISHGRFASGIKSAAELIAGEQENLMAIDAYADGNKAIDRELEDAFAHAAAGDEYIVFTDILGGSVTNQVVRFSGLKNTHIISGMNLPLVLEVLLADPEQSLDEMLHSAIIRAREQIVYVNERMQKQTNND
jgi:fructoselysine and glucoselysine-specific PTS system IIA component